MPLRSHPFCDTPAARPQLLSFFRYTIILLKRPHCSDRFSTALPLTPSVSSSRPA